jgi:hypothetical protein
MSLDRSLTLHRRKRAINKILGKNDLKDWPRNYWTKTSENLHRNYRLNEIKVLSTRSH